MAESAFLESFLKGVPPKSLRLIAAQGLAPLPPAEMLQLLVHLTKDSEQDVSAQARKTLEDWTQEEILPQLQSRACSEPVLDYFAATSNSVAVQEAIILNPAASGKSIATLAARVPATLMETILYNRVRLLEFPEIINGLKNNPAITNQIQVLVQEVESEFFSSKKIEYVVEAQEAPAVAEPETLEAEEQAAPADLSLEGLPTDPQEREAALYRRIAQMTTPQKLRLAQIGPREARTILIRDTNREVCRSVLQNPKLTEAEVESFAAMRNVSDEVLRHIGVSREWTKSYGVIHNLVKNPRTPPFVSMSLLVRLRTRDLTLVARDRGVPEVVRSNAQRALTSRTSTAKGSTA
jgi:hypothetical protein